jgi:symplekin
MQALQHEQLNAATSPLSVEEDEDDYDPDFYNAEDTEQILNKLDSAPPPNFEEEPEVKPPDMAPLNYTLPPPPIMTLEEVEQVGQGTVGRVFDVMQTLEEPGKKSKAGLNRLAASNCDREDWITIITRLATRSVAGLEETESVKVEPNAVAPFSLSNTIRNSLYLYVLEDFRKRIDIAVAWLCEEWYNDKVQMKAGEESVIHYEKWVIKILDGIIPYLDARDKVLTRFLSEIPGLSLEVLTKVKELCRDPAMVNLALTSLLYLVMMRPPVREIALDAVEDIWNTCTFPPLFSCLISRLLTWHRRGRKAHSCQISHQMASWVCGATEGERRRKTGQLFGYRSMMWICTLLSVLCHINQYQYGRRFMGCIPGMASQDIGRQK